MTEQLWVEKAYNKIHENYKREINHGIAEDWLAGLISVECAGLDPKEHRFEPSVWTEVNKVKMGKFSHAYPGFNGGKIFQFISITRDTDTLKTLATSYGLGQIMGYHYFMTWGLLPNVFTNLMVPQSIQYTLEMMASGMQHASNYAELLRWWNTGNINGQTYDPDYVGNATKAAAEYKALLASKSKMA